MNQTRSTVSTMGHPRRTDSMMRLAHRQSGSIDVFAELSVLLKGGHGPLLVNHQPAWRVAGVVPCEAGSADRAERKAEPDLLPHPKRVNPWHPGISAPFAANTDLNAAAGGLEEFRLVQPVHGPPLHAQGASMSARL